jgi:hypothetical protein
MEPTGQPATAAPERNHSRREFVKRAALAGSAVALGLSGAGTAAAQQRDDVLVYTDDYRPGTQFRVVSQIPANITVQLLRRPGGGTVPEISQPDDYNGHAIQYQSGGNVTGATYVFTQGTLQRGVRYRFSPDANVFSSRLSLLNTTVNRVGNQ